MANLNTQHNFSTSHGAKTPHKYPSDDENLLEVLNRLSVQLYPTGRAWYRPENGVWDRFHGALNVSFARLIEESKLLLDQNIPDNVNFSENDAELWEYRLGLITDSGTSIELRRLAINRKLGHPNNIKARQHPFFIQDQLQKAGFQVYVHENTVPYRTPNEILAIATLETPHGDSLQHSDSTQHGGGNFDLIANSVDVLESYAIGGTQNLRATFFIGGPNLGEFASVPEQRLREFKELVLKLKPAHLVAFTFINYL